MTASSASSASSAARCSADETDDSGLLAALLDGMDAALVAFAADGTVTHWNQEAERILGWTTTEAVGRTGLAGWAVRKEDADAIEAALAAAMRSPGRQVHEFALLTKDGHRILVRTQSSAVRAPGGRVAGVYCAFSEVHTQMDLERSIALSEALFEDASWGVVLIDADLRPAVVNAHAARALGVGRTALLGRPLGELLAQGVEELECALQHVLAEGAPQAVADLWVTLRSEEAELPRRCWRSGFVRLSSPLAEEPVPLGVAWLFQDVTDAKRAETEGSLLRFRAHQLHRAGRAAAECPDPAEAAAVHLDFALAGFADHGLVDLAVPPAPRPYGALAEGDAYDAYDEVEVPADAYDTGGEESEASGTSGVSEGAGAAGGAAPPSGATGADRGRRARRGTPRLVRTLASPAGSPGPSETLSANGIPAPYVPGHPAFQAYERRGSVRTSAGPASPAGWAAARNWPDGTVHGLCVVLRSRGRTLGVATFLRAPARRPFDRADADYAEEVAARIATALDLAGAASL
ncbi:PAS domain-containing protein [Streptomyces decoyicus]|uniref:PAS domain-containing protein n=1 Tax=Streptomyces decoyicus TaxID=249567 RepID=UPI0006627D71|nr:PAS domain-containing protein [Streptomyces decoyicus]KOG44562.1 diguanylate cyclase [Streptomyces decoyicus]QZY17656.1 PAS domain-containing protein [Streptomyces decoyicus]